MYFVIISKADSGWSLKFYISKNKKLIINKNYRKIDFNPRHEMSCLINISNYKFKF